MDIRGSPQSFDHPNRYANDFGVDPLSWESTEVGAAPVRAYATNSDAVTIFPAVGTAAIFAAGGATLNLTNATANPTWKYVTTTIDTTTFSNATYDSDGEQSWAALTYMLETFPAYIPKVNSTYFDHVINPISVITDGLLA